MTEFANYFYKDCIFYDLGYLIDQNGYVIYVESQGISEKIGDDKETIEENSKVSLKIGTGEPQSETKASKTAYIIVNEAKVFDRISTNGDAYGNFCNITKGTELKLIKDDNGYYYCDFLDIRNTPRTGWVKKDDITFDRPTNEVELVY